MYSTDNALVVNVHKIVLKIHLQLLITMSVVSLVFFVKKTGQIKQLFNTGFTFR